MSYEISKLKGGKYHIKDVVRIKDRKQQEKYIKREVFPIDMYVTYDEELQHDVLIMLFLRSETKELYKLWKERELD